MKIPQVKPDWNTGIYIGNGVVASKRWKSTSMTYEDAVTEFGQENVKIGMFKRGTGEDDVQVFC